MIKLERVASTILRMEMKIYEVEKMCEIGSKIFHDEYMQELVIEHFGSIDKFFGSEEKLLEFWETGTIYAQIPDPWRQEVVAYYPQLSPGFPVRFPVRHGKNHKPIKRLYKPFKRYQYIKKKTQIFTECGKYTNADDLRERNILFFFMRDAMMTYLKYIELGADMW